MRQLSYYFKNTKKKPHNVPSYATIFDEKYLGERSLVHNPMMDAWNESEVKIQEHKGDVSSNHKRKHDDGMNVDQSKNNEEQPFKKRKLTHCGKIFRPSTQPNHCFIRAFVGIQDYYF